MSRLCILFDTLDQLLLNVLQPRMKSAVHNVVYLSGLHKQAHSVRGEKGNGNVWIDLKLFNYFDTSLRWFHGKYIFETDALALYETAEWKNWNEEQKTLKDVGLGMNVKSEGGTKIMLQLIESFAKRSMVIYHKLINIS